MKLRLVSAGVPSGSPATEDEDVSAVDDESDDDFLESDDPDIRAVVLLGRDVLRDVVLESITDRRSPSGGTADRPTGWRRVLTTVRRRWTQLRLTLALTTARHAQDVLARRRDAVGSLRVIVHTMRPASGSRRSPSAAALLVRPWFGGLVHLTTGADLFILTSFAVYLLGPRPVGVLGGAVVGLGLGVVGAVLARQVGLLVRGTAWMRGVRSPGGLRSALGRVRRVTGLLPLPVGAAVAVVVPLRGVVAVSMLSATWSQAAASRLTLTATLLGAAAVILVPVAQVAATAVGSARPGIATVLLLTALLESAGRRRYLRAERRLRRRLRTAATVVARLGERRHDTGTTFRVREAEQVLAGMRVPPPPPWAAGGRTDEGDGDTQGRPTSLLISIVGGAEPDAGGPPTADPAWRESRRLAQCVDGESGAAASFRPDRTGPGVAVAAVAAVVMLGSLLSGAAVTASYAREARTSAARVAQGTTLAGDPHARHSPAVVLVSASQTAPPRLTELVRAELGRVDVASGGQVEIRMPDGTLGASVPPADPPANGGAAGAGTVVDRLARLLDGPALPSTPPDLLTAIGRATDGRATGTLLVVCAASGACAPEDVADGADRLRDGDRLPLLRGWSVDMIGTVGAGRGAEPPGYTASGAWGSVLRAAGADPVRVDLAPLPAPDPMDVPAVTWAPRSVPEPDVPAPAAPDLPFGGEYLAARFLVGELGFAGESVTVSLRGAELLRIAGEGIAGRSAGLPGLRTVAVRAAPGVTGPAASGVGGRLAQVRAVAVAHELVTAGLPGLRVVVAPPAPDTGAGTEPSVELWELAAA